MIDPPRGEVSCDKGGRKAETAESREQCRVCGRPILTGVPKCPSCGCPVGDSEPLQGVQGRSPNNSPEALKPTGARQARAAKKWLIAGGLTIAAAVALQSLGFLLWDGDTQILLCIPAGLIAFCGALIILNGTAIRRGRNLCPGCGSEATIPVDGTLPTIVHDRACVCGAKWSPAVPRWGGVLYIILGSVLLSIDFLGLYAVLFPRALPPGHYVWFVFVPAVLGAPWLFYSGLRILFGKRGRLRIHKGTNTHAPAVLAWTSAKDLAFFVAKEKNLYGHLVLTAESLRYTSDDLQKTLFTVAPKDSPSLRLRGKRLAITYSLQKGTSAVQKYKLTDSATRQQFCEALAKWAREYAVRVDA